MSPIENEPRAARVLLAEDTPSNAMVLERLIQRLGHSVVVVGDGRAALEALDRESFDLILMDVHMPGMDGLEATREIRRRERARGLPPLPIVALTGSTRDDHRFLCNEAGMNATLPKPIAKQALGQAIAAALAGDPIGPVETGPRSQGSEDVRDRERALAALAGENEILEEVERRMLEEVPAILARLGSAVGSRQARDVESEAHAFKSLLRLVAAGGAAELAERLEQMGQTGRLDAAPQTLAALQSSAADLLREIRRHLSGR
jgi:CheY-like chemotaxis protein/HPt (histidine-containing phosphotransfer) domain-containing protein